VTNSVSGFGEQVWYSWVSGAYGLLTSSSL
jgi:hypothetical protein